MKGAGDSYEESLRIAKELYEETGTKEAKYDVMFSYYKLGTLDGENHQNNYIMTAYKMITELVEAYPGIEKFEKMKKFLEYYVSVYYF